MSDSIFPPAARKCHRCNFDKSCRELVVSEACGRWARLDTEEAPGKTKTVYMCQDDLELGLAMRTQKILSSLVDSLEHFRDQSDKNHKSTLAVNTALTHAALTAGKKADFLIENLQEQLPLALSPPDSAAPLGIAPPE
jgi:hypothetical protein